MDCERFLDRLESLAEGEIPPGEFERHGSACPACAKKLSRARNLAVLLRSVPAAGPPRDLKARVLSAAFRPPAYRRPLVLVAAAILVLVGLSSAAAGLLWPGRAYEPLDLTVLRMAEQNSAEEDFAIELMYGPGVPIGELSAAEGVGDDDDGFADDR
jgi:anti-sigma factor RsiW